MWGVQHTDGTLVVRQIGEHEVNCTEKYTESPARRNLGCRTLFVPPPSVKWQAEP